ncbi:Dorsal-ventral patterning tolloid, partial [Paramuricea clavata]
MPRMLVKQSFLITFMFLTLFLGGSFSSETKKPKRGKCPRRQIRLTGSKLGTIETPGYPHPYRRSQICWWRIKVPRGFFVHLEFHDKIGIACTSKDRVAVSSGPLYYRVVPRGSGTTAVLCGQSRMSNVSVPGRQMWVRFHAVSDGSGKQQNIGFRATYRAMDNDECKREEHKCEQNCINKIGSYRCSCNLGYMLDNNGLNCT